MDVQPVMVTADQVLRVFHRDEVYLFLGAAFATVGLISVALAFLGRKFDALLLWLGIFSFLYGNRLWLQTGLLELMVPPTPLFHEMRESSNYLVTIPAFFYMRSAGFLGRLKNWLTYPLTAIMLYLTVGVFVVGPLRHFKIINRVTVIVAMLLLAIRFIREISPTREFRILRLGMLAFAAPVLWDNAVGPQFPIRLEPFGFAVFLATLGYIAARRNMDRDAQWASVEKELELAQQMQQSILPTAFPTSADFRVAARYAPMLSVAGDFYDFLPTGDREAGLLIADVSGHGLPAALIASMVKLAASSQRAHAADPAALLAGMNQVLCGNTKGQYVTAAYVYLDANTAELSYAAAAHPPMLLLRDGEVQEILENGLMLGLFEETTYATAVHRLQAGDRLLLYTDGVTEAENASEEEFGPERLFRLLRETRTLSHDATADRILESVRQWSSAQEDDLTLLVCDYRSA
jgi:sigma-B regulation protein RsbU (phosphoserine phosphatase)